MKESSTQDLSRELMSESNLDAYLSRNQPVFSDEDVANLLNRLYQRTDLSKAALARQAGMSEVYLHQVFSGRRKPSRDRLLCLCICMGASLEEIQQALKHATYAPSTPSTSGTPSSVMGSFMALFWKKSMKNWPRNRSRLCSEWTSPDCKGVK